MPEKYRLLNGEDSRPSSEDLAGHEYLSRRDDSKYKFSKKSVILTGCLLIAALATNVVLAVLTLRKSSVGTPSGGASGYKSPIGKSADIDE